MMTDVPVRYRKPTRTTPSPSALPDAKMADWLPWTSTWASANGERSLLSNTWTFICTSVRAGTEKQKFSHPRMHFIQTDF